jgi:hypothetical protein
MRHRFIGRVIKFAACVGFIAVSSPVKAQEFRNAPFWMVPNSTSDCRASFEGIGPFTLSRDLVRRAWPNDDAVNFNTHVGMMFSQAIGGRNINEFKAFLLRAAAAKSYTNPVHQKGGWSPIYVQSNLIRQIAMSILFLENRGILSTAERQQLVAWGSAMVPGQKGTRNNQSSDSLLASGAAMLAWGNVTGDTRLMRDGYRQFMKGYPYVVESIGQLKRHPAHRSIPISGLSLEDEYNVAFQHAIEGAAILRNLGLDLFSAEISGRTLHDAVAWWTPIAASRPEGFKGYRPWSHNFHLGWIPIYLRFYPDRPVSAQLRALDRKVTAGRTPSYRATSLGGSTKCLW